METIVKEKVQGTKTGYETIDNYNKIINETLEYVNSKTYEGKPLFTIKGEIKYLTKEDYFDLGIRMQKRLKRYTNNAKKKMSLSSVNRLLYLVHKKILKLDKSPRIISERHNLIQKLRKEWKDYQIVADGLLKEYKNEKGNFYKENKLILKD